MVRCSEEGIVVVQKNEEVDPKQLNDCVMRVEDNNVFVVFPYFESESRFTCLNEKETDIFIGQLKEVLCAITITMEVDIELLANTFNQVDTGEFVTFEINLNKYLEEKCFEKQIKKGSHILLIWIEGDIFLSDFYDIEDKIVEKSKNDYFLSAGTYDNSYKSNYARVSIWYKS